MQLHLKCDCQFDVIVESLLILPSWLLEEYTWSFVVFGRIVPLTIAMELLCCILFERESMPNMQAEYFNPVLEPISEKG